MFWLPKKSPIQQQHETLPTEQATDMNRKINSRTISDPEKAEDVTQPSEFQVMFETDDPENPKNWSTWYRGWTMATVAFSAWVVVLYSTSYTSSVPGLMIELGASKTVSTAGMATYLFGLAMGSLVMAPLSELYGRRIVYILCLTVWALTIIPCGLATSLATILAVRFISGCFGAALVANGPGTVVDVSQPQFLAMGMSLYSLGPFNGPIVGPIIGGFVFQYAGWRWTNWMVLVMGGLAITMMFTIKETYAPKILRDKASRMRQKTGDQRWWCQHDRNSSSIALIRKSLWRPCKLFFTEPIVWFINIWNAVIYGILYLCFIAYPVVFSQHRGWGPGQSGLAFLGIGVGIISVIAAEPLIRKLINMYPRDPVTGKTPPEAAALIMALGAVLTPIGQFGFAWTCLPTSIHWVISILFGIPFGAGNTLSFIYSSNYLAGAYGIYAASALASNAVIRSLFGATLPLAGAKMYSTMTPQLAGTLCGVLAVAMVPIPFVFWRWGASIRDKSKTIKYLREKERADGRRQD